MKQKETQILLILSGEEEAAKFREALDRPQDGSLRLVDIASDGRGALLKLERSKYDICLLDEWLPDMDSLELLRSFQAGDMATPVVFLVENEDDPSGPRALEEGARATFAKNTMTPELLHTVLSYVMKLDRNEKRLKQAEEGFLREQIRNKHLLEAVSSILIGVRGDGIVTHWNSVAEKTFDLPAELVLKNPLDSCRIEWDFNRLREGIGECLKTGRQVRLDDLWYAKKGGETGLLGFTINPLSSAPDGIDEVILLGADVTERRRASEKMRVHAKNLELANSRIEKEKAKDEAILESIGEGLIATDDKGRIILANRQAEVMFDMKAQEITGKLITDILSIQDERGQKIADKARPTVAALKTGRKTMMKAVYVRPDHSLLPLHISVSPVILERKIIGAIGIFRDITQEKEIERAKTDFISTVSHELRTPLTSIREGVAQVYEGILGPINGDQKEFLEIALEEVDRLAAIINDLLDISKIEAGKVALRKTWIVLTDLIKEIMFNYQPVMKNKGLILESYVPDHAVEIFCDPDKIKQIITNLLTNAHKFTEPGGRVDIEVSEKATEVVITVSDTGRGISKENVPKLFDKFVQIGRTAGPGIKGTGLGLAISKNLVEMHGGEIWVDSQVNKGSSFHFSLPKLKRDMVAKENIEHGLKNLGKDGPGLSVLVLKLLRGSAKTKKNVSAETLKIFLKELDRRFIDGSGDAFLNGSDECIIILPLIDKKTAGEIGEEFKLRLAALLDARHEPQKVNLGISTFPEDADTSELLLRKARVRMTAIDDELERRSSIRKNFEKSLTLKGDMGKTFEAQSVDISEGGVRLYGSCSFEVGTKTELWLELPKNHGLIHSKAVVVWQRQGAQGTYMLGLKFLGISDAARRKIRKFIASEAGTSSAGGPEEFRKSA